MMDNDAQVPQSDNEITKCKSEQDKPKLSPMMKLLLPIFNLSEDELAEKAHQDYLRMRDTIRKRLNLD